MDTYNIMKTIVLGPPGTGKTRTLLDKVAELLKKTDPNKIGYFAFTRKAANEARDRYLKSRPDLEKKDIKYLHTSNEGHKVYSFKYKDGDTKYSGVMAQDVLKINTNTVTLINGMIAVYYDMIDVNMQQLDII